VRPRPATERTVMLKRNSIGPLGLLTFCATVAAALEDAKFPDLGGQWDRVGIPRWVQAGQKAPLTPEYQKVFETNVADMAAGGHWSLK
jgi:hypothetical protein